jgi:hypothetical protein
VCTGFWCGSLRERDRWGDPGVDGRIMLGWIFKKYITESILQVQYTRLYITDPYTLYAFRRAV